MRNRKAELLGSAAAAPSPPDAAPAAAEQRPIDRKWDGRTIFTIVEAGEILGLSRWTAYAAAKAGNLPVVWIGRTGRVPRHALEQMLLNVGPRRAPAAATPEVA